MALRLHYHPLSSFCMKALIGLYEVGAPFSTNLVDLQDPAQRAALFALWPVGKFPVLEDTEGPQIIPESTIILEYLDQRFGPGRLLPTDPTRALQCRLRDRFYDQYIHHPMQRIVADRLRPEGQRDPLGVAQAREQIDASYDIAERELGATGWCLGDDFTMADCAAAPALFYARKLVPFGPRPRLSAYHERLASRPSFTRVLAEAAPYLAMFPG